MGLSGDGRQTQLGQRFGNTDDSFKLTNGDGNGRAGVGVEFSTVDLLSDGDKVR